MTSPSHLDAIRPEARAARQSGIVELFNYGRGREGLIPLWVGEGDLPTPDFIAQAARRSFAAGETFLYGPARPARLPRGHRGLYDALLWRARR